MRTSIRLLFGMLGLTVACTGETVLRVGFFPNVTHAQGLIGYETALEGHGWFEARLGPGVKIEWFSFNAGPSAMEGLLAGSIDVAYVGPSPAINVYERSEGEEIRVLAGAAEGGEALLVPGDRRIADPADFRGMRIATPEIGNTQDVTARAWFIRHGLRVTMTGGDVIVAPVANADQLSLFERGQIDAVWTVEPWVSILEKEAGARVFLEQRRVPTTVLVASSRFLRAHPELARKFLDAHKELTSWIHWHGGEARSLVGSGIQSVTRRALPEPILASAWKRLSFTDRVDQRAFEELLADAEADGFLRNTIPLDSLFSPIP